MSAYQNAAHTEFHQPG